MSYDLLLKGATELPFDDIDTWLGSSEHIELERHADTLVYRNTNTGVYFILEGCEDGISVFINYNRPSFFPTEAFLTAIAFAKKFDWTIEDPQLQRSVQRDASELGALLTSWQNGNKLFSESATLVASHEMATRTFWYNYRLPKINRELAALGQDVYVPKIFYVGMPTGNVTTALLWAPGVTAIALPEVDHLLLAKQQRLGSGFDFEKIDRDNILEAAAANVRALEPLGEIPTLHFSSQQAVADVLRKAKRLRFDGEIISSDAFVDTLP